jgi:hypothetical protein
MAMRDIYLDGALPAPDPPTTLQQRCRAVALVGTLVTRSTPSLIEPLARGIEQLVESELAAAKAALETVRGVLRELVTRQGVRHDDEECPEDDTCRCPNIARVNAALQETPR